MKPLLIALGSMLLASSCYTVRHEYQGKHEITPGTRLSQPSTTVGRVHAERRAKYLLWGLIDLNSASAPMLLDDEAMRTHGQFDGITRVSIHEEMDVLDVIVTGLTLGIFSMISVETEGEVHRYAATGGGQ